MVWVRGNASLTCDDGCILGTRRAVQGGTSKVKTISVTNARLAGGGERVVWGAGLFALGGFADRVGLTAALSAAVPRRGERAPVHDRGKVLTHALLTLAAGGEACSDIEHLGAAPELFGGVGRVLPCGSDARSGGIDLGLGVRPVGS